MAQPLDWLMSMLQPQNPQVQPVRPLEQMLAGAQIRPLQKSPYEPTLAPGEQRSQEDLRRMLGDVILAAGSMAVPGVVPMQEQLARARYNPTNYRLPRNKAEREQSIGTYLGEFHPPKDSGLPVGNLYRIGKDQAGKSVYKVLVVEDGLVRAESEPLTGSQLRRAGSYNISAARSINKYELNDQSNGEGK